MIAAFLRLAVFACALTFGLLVVSADPNDLESQPRICMAKLPHDLDIDNFPADHPDVSCVNADNDPYASSRAQPLGTFFSEQQDLWTTDQFALDMWTVQQIARSPLLVSDCEEADLVFVPLTLQWTRCYGHAAPRDTMANFTANLNAFLPLLDEKPHFLAIPGVAEFEQRYYVDLDVFLDAGIFVLTIEGTGRPEYIDVPYPGHYHSHAGLKHNRFMQSALSNKTDLAFGCFSTGGHGFNPSFQASVRQEILSACDDAPDCHHMWPGPGIEYRYWGADFFEQASKAWFCLQPPGDSATRQSTFDCISAGGIPVFLEPLSVARFPFTDVVDAASVVVLEPRSDARLLFTENLASISMEDRQKRLQTLAKYAHIYQYSLHPHSGLITWGNIAQVEVWDDAFTFTIKTVLRHSQRHMHRIRHATSG